MTQQYAEVACDNCGTVLVLRFEQTAVRAGKKHSIGCPECQATTSVVAKWHELERTAAPEFIHLTALEKKTEIALGSSTPAEPKDTGPHTPAKEVP